MFEDLDPFSHLVGFPGLRVGPLDLVALKAEQIRALQHL